MKVVKIMKAETHLWEQYKQRITKDPNIQSELDAQYSEYLSVVDEIHNAHNKFRSSLAHLPIGVALRAWMASATNKKIANEQAEQILTIIDSKALPLKLSRKDILTLGYLQESGQEAHKQILEEIRCNTEWSIDKKEELVKCYIQFSGYLNEATDGIIPKALDRDREGTLHKVVQYDTFVEFIQELSERDALIAKLLYFGAPGVEDVLLLVRKDINSKSSSIRFQKDTVAFPKYLIEELLSHSKLRKQGELVFLNVRGDAVEGTHLSKSFKRISEKLDLETQITPRELSKAKTEIL